MVDLGFEEDIREIMSYFKGQRQMLMFRWGWEGGREGKEAACCPLQLIWLARVLAALT